jgi:anti-anti-sigma regulatory factor
VSDDIPTISFGALEGGLYLGVNSRATQRVCATAEKLIADFLAAAAENAVVTIDLNDCAWIDSTFGGWLIGVRKRLEPRRGSLRILNCAERCRASLDRMRLTELFEFADADAPSDVRTVNCPPGDQPDAAALELMVRAHDELAALSEENRQLFAPIAEMLRQQIAELRQGA